MFKKSSIIGFLVAWTLLAPGFAHAQDDPSEDCVKSLYDSEFTCESSEILGFCTGIGDSPLSFYKSAYCNLQEQDEDEIYGIVADQMNANEPGWDADLVKLVLTNISGSALVEFAGGETEKDLVKLPPTLVAAYVTAPLFLSQADIYAKVKTAYENEKVLAKSKRTLKRQFQAREMWANGSLSDAPFDLVIDLNLIEIVLFGSEAKWMDDVYTFPKFPTGGAAVPPAAPEAGPTPDTGAESAQDETPPQSTEGTGPQPEAIGCTPVEELIPGVAPPGQVPPNCGNGSVETGEECDDRNTVAGDGCSESCKNEAGNTLACMDPQAVTFKPFVPKPTTPPRSGATANTGEATPANPPPKEIPIDCPPGTKATVGPKPVTQSSNYLGPNVYGVLKEFPPSNEPACPEGMREYSVAFNEGGSTPTGPENVGGSATVGGSQEVGVTLFGQKYSLPRCVPTSACADFEAARKLLFGDNYKDDPVKSELAAAIETFICVKVTTKNRPESPYPVNEGCVDCHILAMNDIMGKLLEKNVTCLENNMQAWGLSNRWGPSISFNLDILSQIGTNALRRGLEGEKPDQTPAERSLLAAKKIEKDAKHTNDPASDTPSVPQDAGQTSSESLNITLAAENKKQDDIRQGMKFFSATAEARVVDQESFAPISDMLSKMLGSFQRLQNLYIGLSYGVKFHEKKECKF